MKPVLILQNQTADGPAYLADWLHHRGLPLDVRDAEAGQPWPDTMDGHAALAVLGGEMSANDPLPSLRRAEALILEAMRAGKPVVGHCLGGQLMARALGAAVRASPAPEVGWQPMQVLPQADALRWFGESASPCVFQWHYEAFDLPAGATALASSVACPRQAFSIGPHLAMQFHIEVDAEKIGRWSLEQGVLYQQALRDHATVQDGASIRAGIDTHLRRHQALADRVYGHWIAAAGPR